VDKFKEDVKPLRVTVNRSVEFYVSKILSGELKVSTQNKSVKESIESIWKWSNFNSQKNIFSRYLALTGNLFVKVVNDDSKVWFENIDPKFVTDFSSDSRGYLQTIRIDVPITVEGKNLTNTEYWEKNEEGGYYAIWTHTQDENAELENLGEPLDTGFLAELGIDFIPIVHVRFKDIGEKWGVGAVNHALPKIDEASRQATKLHQLFYNYGEPTWIVSANDKDAQGRPMPAPKLKATEIKQDMIYLPGKSTLDLAIANLAYESGLNILNAQMEEINNDCPEIRFYSLKDGSLSGKAIRSLLSAAISRAEESRANMLQGIERLDSMALTIGVFSGFFAGIGTFDGNDFEHSILCSPMFPLDDDEKATTIKSLVEAGMSLKSAMRFAGLSEEQIEQAMQEKDEQDIKVDARKQQNLATSLMSFDAGTGE
jgi:hypothetical protein